MILRDATVRELGLFDLLTWEMLVDDGLLRTVDGALAATMEYRGPDLDSATKDELSALSRSLTRVVDLLGDGWMLHTEALRLPAPPYPASSSFPDPATEAIDAARRETYTSHQARFYTRYYLTLTQARPIRRGVGFFKSGTDSHEVDAETRDIERFEEVVSEVRRQLSTHLRIWRLGTVELVRYLHTTLTGRDQPVQVSHHGITLESLFGAGELYGGTELRLSDQHIVPISLINLPEGTTPASLAFLDELALPYRASYRFLCMDRYTAKGVIASHRRRWSTAGLSPKEFFAFAIGGPDAKPKYRDRHAPRMAQDADDAIAELDRLETSAGFLTSTILTFDTEREQAVRQAHEIVKELRNRGFLALVETYNAVEAYLGSLPAHGLYNRRRPIVTNRAYVDLAPTTAVWSGQLTNPHPALADQGPCIVAATDGATPFFWSLASGDVQHTLITGPIGAGKSTLVNLLIAQYLRYRDAQVFSIDKGWGQYLLCHAAGGCHYAPSPDRPEGDRFAPLAHIDSAAERSGAVHWIEDLLQLQGVDIGPPERAAILRAVELLAASSRRTLSAFAAKVQDTRLRAALAPYVGDGPLAHLFGAQRSALREGHLHVVEMESLLGLREKALTPVILHLFAEIERRLDGRPTLLIIEEAPNYLANTLFVGRFRQWLLELRKRNTGVILVTQLLSSLLESQLRDAILENCPQRVFLPNAAARDPHATAAYRAFGLSDRQIELIADATAKRDYYLNSPEGSRMIQLGLSDVELALLGRSGPRIRDAVDRARAEHGAAWVERFALRVDDGRAESR